MTALHPETEPFDVFRLPVGDGHTLHVEQSGRPDGRPVVLLHGGPGSGMSPGMRRFFDPQAWRVISFDQRGCGESTPSAADPTTDLAAITTERLLADLERLRSQLGIDAWTLFGVSWGCTLGLAYAERDPRRIRGCVFAGITMTRPSEIDWLYRGVAPLFPAAWQRFREGVPLADRDGNLVEAYSRLLSSPEARVRDEAAQAFHDWEAALLSADPEAKPPARWSDAPTRLARARLVTHFFRHRAWLEDGALLRGAPSLANVPAILVHGRLDLSAPLATAWELAGAWPGAELVIVPGAGHSPGDIGMSDAIVAAVDRLR